MHTPIYNTHTYTYTGGQFNLAKTIPGKEEFYETIRYYNKQLNIYNVNILLNTNVTSDMLAEKEYDAVSIYSICLYFVYYYMCLNFIIISIHISILVYTRILIYTMYILLAYLNVHLYYTHTTPCIGRCMHRRVTPESEYTL